MTATLSAIAAQPAVLDHDDPIVSALDAKINEARERIIAMVVDNMPGDPIKAVTICKELVNSEAFRSKINDAAHEYFGDNQSALAEHVAVYLRENPEFLTGRIGDSVRNYVVSNHDNAHAEAIKRFREQVAAEAAGLTISRDIIGFLHAHYPSEINAAIDAALLAKEPEIAQYKQAVRDGMINHEPAPFAVTDSDGNQNLQFTWSTKHSSTVDTTAQALLERLDQLNLISTTGRIALSGCTITPTDFTRLCFPLARGLAQLTPGDSHYWIAELQKVTPALPLILLPRGAHTFAAIKHVFSFYEDTPLHLHLKHIGYRLDIGANIVLVRPDKVVTQPALLWQGPRHNLKSLTF